MLWCGDVLVLGDAAWRAYECCSRIHRSLTVEESLLRHRVVVPARQPCSLVFSSSHGSMKSLLTSNIPPCLSADWYCTLELGGWLLCEGGYTKVLRRPFQPPLEMGRKKTTFMYISSVLLREASERRLTANIDLAQCYGSASLWCKCGSGSYNFHLYLDLFATLMRIRIQLITLMRIGIHLVTLLRFLVDTEPEFLNVYGAQESIPRNKFRQPI
jgi:hypothetical protein